MGYQITPEIRFMRKVEKTSGCWLWRGKIAGCGHGRFVSRCINQRPELEYAHRWAYRHFVGELVSGEIVHHTCGVKHCVNPKHLMKLSGVSEHSLLHPTPKCKPGCRCRRHRAGDLSC